jgi:hypothetical protein
MNELVSGGQGDILRHLVQVRVYHIVGIAPWQNIVAGIVVVVADVVVADIVREDNTLVEGRGRIVADGLGLMEVSIPVGGDEDRSSDYRMMRKRIHHSSRNRGSRYGMQVHVDRGMSLWLRGVDCMPSNLIVVVTEVPQDESIVVYIDSQQYSISSASFHLQLTPSPKAEYFLP